MAKQHMQPEAIRVKEDRDAERPIIVHPEDDDLFVRTGKQVIQACRLEISVELWMRELVGMFGKVRDWIQERPGRVRSCDAAPRGSRVVLFFVPATEQFDFDLADELADLNSQLIKEFNVGMVEVHQVPGAELDRFLDLSTARRLYGEQPRPHPAVEA